MTDESLVDSSAIKVLNELKRYRQTLFLFCQERIVSYASTTSAGTPSTLYRLRAMSKLIDLRP